MFLLYLMANTVRERERDIVVRYHHKHIERGRGINSV